MRLSTTLSPWSSLHLTLVLIKSRVKLYKCCAVLGVLRGALKACAEPRSNVGGGGETMNIKLCEG